MERVPITLFFAAQEPAHGDIIQYGPSAAEGFAELPALADFGRWDAGRREVVGPDLRPRQMVGRRGWCWAWVPTLRLVPAELLHED